MKRDGKSSKREIELGKARKAGYFGDGGLLARALCERQTASYAALMEACRAGERMRARDEAAGTLEARA